MGEEMALTEPPERSSPPWQPGTRLVAGVALLALTAMALYLFRQFVGLLILAVLIAYILHPLVTYANRKLRLSRGLVVLIVYLLVVLALVGMTTGVGVAVSQPVIRFANYLSDLGGDLSTQLAELAEQTYHFGPFTIDLSQINLDPFVNDLASALQPLLLETGTFLASVAQATASLITMLFLVLIFGYYMLLDFEVFDDRFLEIVPQVYRQDFRWLLDETGRVWSAFFRGQLTLALVVGLIVTVLMTLMGVRFSLGIGLISGLAEFIPFFGPFIAGVVAFLVSLLQGSNWFGLSPFGFSLLVLGVFLVIQQVEQNILVPRIIGQSLNLHPLTVLLALLAGGVLAGIFGILLAAPAVATLRIWLGYVYRKSVGLGTWPGPIMEPSAETERRFQWRDLLRRFRRTEPGSPIESKEGEDRG
jgi:predicted PurR-regulated permease PerM